MSRQADAIYISNGACNPIGIAGTLHKHMLDMHAAGADSNAIREDPAIRLIVHQLAHLVRVQEMEDLSIYRGLREACRKDETWD